MIGFRLPGGQQIELGPGATISLEINNSLLAESDNNGSFTLPVLAPRTPGNERTLNFAGLLDSPAGTVRRLENVQAFDDGLLLAVGTLLLLRVTPTAYELSLQTGASAVMAKLKGRKLRDFHFGGQRQIASPANAGNFLRFLTHMNYVAAHPDEFDYVFAPVSNNDLLAENPPEWVRRVNVNTWLTAVPPVFAGGFSVLASGNVPIQSVQGPAYIPGYPGFYAEYQQFCVPFPKLAYVVRTLLAELNIPLEEDFFDEETEQLVVISNTAVDDPRSNSAAATLDPAVHGVTFRIGDVLPDISAHELLRKLADTCYLDLSTSPLGALRLRRTNALLAAPPAAVLTALAAPGYTIDVPAEVPAGLATAYRSEHDVYASGRYQEVDPQMRAADVASATALPVVPGFPHEIRLVLDTRTYHQHDGTAWVLYSVDLPTVTVGPGGEQATSVPQGTELVLEEEMQTVYLVPLPGGAWPPVGTQPDHGVLRACVFGEPGYSPTFNALNRSVALRLGFYRGMQPYKTAAQGTFPLLTQTNFNMQGSRLGTYSLRLDGPDGTVARFGQALLEARRAAAGVVSWPVWLTAEQINQLDLARRVEIAGIHFLVKKINVTFPIRRPAELQLVVLPPKAVLV